MGWGDWQLVICIREADLADARSIVEGAGETFNVVGSIARGRGVHLIEGRVAKELRPPQSERFTTGSWFEAGINSYVDSLVNDPFTAS
jgi:hypothetical protein